MKRHQDGPVCPECYAKLEFADPRLAAWFWKKKAQHPLIHIAWSWRGQVDQDKAFKEGKSKVKWPNSKHNHMDGGKPSSLALDLFLIDADGMSRWPMRYYEKIHNENVQDKEPIRWGGTFKGFKDGPHFELIV